MVASGLTKNPLVWLIPSIQQASYWCQPALVQSPLACMPRRHSPFHGSSTGCTHTSKERARHLKVHSMAVFSHHQSVSSVLFVQQSNGGDLGMRRQLSRSHARQAHSKAASVTASGLVYAGGLHSPPFCRPPLDTQMPQAATASCPKSTAAQP